MPENKDRYEVPMVIGDDSDYRPEGCTWVAVCVVVVVAAAVAGNVAGVVNAAAAWNGGYYANVAYLENWVTGPDPPCK